MKNKKIDYHMHVSRNAEFYICIYRNENKNGNKSTVAAQGYSRMNWSFQNSMVSITLLTLVVYIV